MPLLDVIILVYNEEKHLARALQSVRTIARDVYVIDSGSDDRTVAIAREYGAVVLSNPFVTQAQQMAWAIENVPLRSDWVMRLDADEVIEAALANEIAAQIGMLPDDVTGISLKRKQIFMGRWIRHGGRYPLMMLRIWRRGTAHCEDRWMDEHMVIDGGRVVTFEHPFSDNNLNDLTFFTAKHNSYATREAIDVLSRRYHLAGTTHTIDMHSASGSTALKRIIKEHVYNRLPFWVGPLGYFLFRMIIQLGFLDGREGLIYHFIQGFWYRFLVGAKVFEYDRVLRGLPDRSSRAALLAQLTGQPVAGANTAG